MALVVNESSAGEGEEEGREGVAGFVAGQGSVEVDEGFLGEVFGIDTIT